MKKRWGLNGQRPRLTCLVAAGTVTLGLSAAPAFAQADNVVFEDPETFQIKGIWTGASLGVPPNLGGLLFSETGDVLYVVGASETFQSAL